MGIRRWQSKVGTIALDPFLQRELDQTQAQAEYDVILAPTCHRCTALGPGKRIHVDKYGVVDFGKQKDTPFVVFKAWHHGEESVLRIEGWSWPPRDGERFKFALARLPFFTDQAEATIRVPVWWNTEYA